MRFTLPTKWCRTRQPDEMEQTSTPPSQPLSSKPPGFATLARRISVWTTNSLLTLLVLVAGLGFGRQVLKWWAADASPPPGGSAVALTGDALGDPAQLHTIQFGDASWSWSRQTVAGDKHRMIERLRAACRDVLNAKVQPATAPEKSPSPSEQKFLDFLSATKPVAESPGQWRVYEFAEAFPMAVGLVRATSTPHAPHEVTEVTPRSTPHAPHEGPDVTRSVTSTGSDVTRSVTSTARTDDTLAGANLAQAGYRVVVWAIAVPAGTGGWTVCRFEPRFSSSGGAAGPVQIPLPPGCRRGLSLRAGGSGITAFDGPNAPEQWKRFFGDWFQRQGWRTSADWQATGPAWYAKFAAHGRGAVDLHFGPDGRGGLSGLLMVTPSETK